MSLMGVHVLRFIGRALGPEPRDLTGEEEERT